MKQWIGIILIGLMVAACGSDGPVAPKEGRKSIGLQPAVLTETGKAPQVAEPEAVEQWLFAFANVANNRPHAWMNGDIQRIRAIKSVSIGKGTSPERLALGGPVVTDGVAYTLDGAFGLQATDLTTGKRLWRRKLSEITGVSSGSVGLALHKKRLYAVSADGWVVVTDLTGQGVWKRDLKTQLRSEPIIVSERLFLASVQNELFALDINDGHTLWQYEGDQTTTGFFGVGTPAVAKGYVLVPTTNGRINAFDAATGILLWTENMWTNKTFNPLLDMPHITASPVVDQQIVYVMGNAGKTGAYRLKDGTRLFTVPIGGRETPVISGKTLFAITNQNRLVALNKNQGAQYWSVPLTSAEKHPVWFGPVAVNNAIVVVSSNGDLVFYNIQDGQELRREQVKPFVKAPVVADGRLLLLTAKGDLLIYQ